MAEWICVVTGRETTSKSDRLPRGWHRLPSGEIVSPEGWGSLYAARSIVIPIAGPIGREVDGEIVEAKWSDLRADLRVVMSAANRLRNWCYRQILNTEPGRGIDDKKLAPRTYPYLYPASKEIAPELDATSRAAILRHVEQDYRADRYEMIWLGRRSARSYRHDRETYPIPAQAVKLRLYQATEKADAVPCLRVRLNGTPWLLRMRGGHQYRRKIAAFHRARLGEAALGEVSLYEIRASIGASDRRPDGIRPGTRLVARMSMHLPIAATRERPAKSMIVTAGDGCLLRAVVEGREKPWVLHSLHARRWVAQNMRRNAAISDDLKAERRRPKQEMRDIAEIREVWSAKFADRMDSITHEAAAQLIGFAQRMGVTTISYADSDATYLPSFPWAILRQKISYKAHEASIAMIHASGTCDDPSLGVARNDAT